jgi:thioredoxin reductase
MVDVVVIGAGPAGLSAGLNLARARRTVHVVDSNRPRNAATLQSHGFLTRDGVSPLELRALGRAELARYPDVDCERACVAAIAPGQAGGFSVTVSQTGGGADRAVNARSILIASGLVETLPEIEGLRVFYGTSLHSCIECDGYEKRDAPVALIGETDDLAARAALISQWSSDLVVFTNGVGGVSADEEAALARRGVRVERRPITEIVGERGEMTAVLLRDGERVKRTGGFVRPRWSTNLDYAAELSIETDAEGYIAVDSDGRTSVSGVYAAGDSVAPGPTQLIIAAGFGARAAAAINRDLIGL